MCCEAGEGSLRLVEFYEFYDVKKSPLSVEKVMNFGPFDDTQ